MKDLLRCVLEHPGSVGARRRLANYWRTVGDPRAELIERQLTAFDGLPIDTGWEILDEIDDLIKAHGREWAGPIAEVTPYFWFEFGLVYAVSVTGDQFLASAADLVRAAPIVALTLSAPLDLAAVSKVPQLAQIRRLNVVPGTNVNDEALVEFAKSPHIRGLRAINLSGSNITERGCAALAQSPYLPDLVYVEFGENPCGSSAGGIEVAGRHYLLGPMAGPHLQKAHESAARSYDVGGLHEWPPIAKEFMYDE